MRDETSVTANSERGGHSGITAPFENVSEKNITLHVINTNDKTQNKLSDEIGELLVPDTPFERQPHTHHTNTIFTLSMFFYIVHNFKISTTFFLPCVYLHLQPFLFGLL